VDMDGWWWMPIGLVAWFAVAMAVALWLGQVLRSCSQARETLDQHTARMLPVQATFARSTMAGSGSS
jgi:hypothetical protein